MDVDKFKYLGSIFIASGQGTEQISFAISSMVAAWNIVAYKGQGLPGSDALDSALRLRDMASASSRRRMLEVFDHSSIRCILRYGAEVVCHPWNCGATSALQVYRHCSCKEGSACLVMLQDVAKMS